MLYINMALIFLLVDEELLATGKPSDDGLGGGPVLLGAYGLLDDPLPQKLLGGGRER